MARAGLAFGSTSLQAMGLGLSPNPYAPFSPRSAQIGPSELAPPRTALDLAAPYVAALNQNAQFSLPPSRAPVAPRLLYSPSTQQLYVNGRTFHQEDASSALQADQGLASPTPSAPPPVNVADWRPMSDAEYQQYIDAIRNPGLGQIFGKNVESGVRGLRQLYDYAGIYTGINREGAAADLNTIDRENNYNDPYMRQLSDIHDVGSAAEFAVAAMGQGIPSILEAVAYALAGGVVGMAAAGPGGAATGVLAGATEGLAADGVAQIAGFSLRQSLRAGARTFMEAAARNESGASVRTILDSIPDAAARADAETALKGAREVVQNRYAFGASQLHMQALGTADTYGQAIQEGANPDTPGLRLSSAIAGIPYSLLELPDTAAEIALIRGGLSRVGRRPLRDLLAAPFAAAGYEFGAEAGQQAITEGTAQQFTGVPINPVDVLNAGAMGAVPGFLFGAGASGIHALSSHDNVSVPPAPTPPPAAAPPAAPINPSNPAVPGGAAFPTVGLHPDYVHTPENTANPAEGYNLPEFGTAPGIGAPPAPAPVNNRAAFLRRGPASTENYNQMTQPNVTPIATVLSPPTGEELANSNPELRAHLALKGQSTAPLQQANQNPSESNIANTALLVRLRSAFKRDNVTQVTNDELHAAENIILNRQVQPQWQLESAALKQEHANLLLHIQHELQQRGEPVQWQRGYEQNNTHVKLQMGNEPIVEGPPSEPKTPIRRPERSVTQMRGNTLQRAYVPRGQGSKITPVPDTSERITSLEVPAKLNEQGNKLIKQARLKREEARNAVQKQSTNAEAVRNESPDRPGVRPRNEPQATNEPAGKGASEGQQTQAGSQEAQVSLEKGNPEAHAAIMAELKNKSSKAKSAASIITQRFNLKKTGKPIYQYFKAHQAEYEAELTKLREAPHPVLKTAAERQTNVEAQRWFADAIKEQPQLIRQAYELKNNNRADPLGVLAQHYASILRKTYGDDYIEFFGLRISPDKDATGGLREVAEQAIALARKRIADAAIESKFNKAGGFSNSARLGQVRGWVQRFIDTKPINSQGYPMGWDSKGMPGYAHDWLKANEPEYDHTAIALSQDVQLLRKRYAVQTVPPRVAGRVFTLKGIERVDLRLKGARYPLERSGLGNKDYTAMRTIHNILSALDSPILLSDKQVADYYREYMQNRTSSAAGLRSPRERGRQVAKYIVEQVGAPKGSLRRPTTSEFLGGNHKQAVEAVVQAWIKKNVSPHHELFTYIFRNSKEFRESAAAVYKLALSAFLEEVPGSTERDFLNWMNQTSAFISGNNVIIFSDFHQTKVGIKKVLAHEVLAHYGMSGVMDATQREEYLNKLRVIRDQSPRLKRLIAEQPKVMKYTETEQIEEALAKIAEGLESSEVQRWWAAILKFLDKIGITLDGVEAYKLLQASADFVRSGKVTSTYSQVLKGSSTDVFGNPALERVATYRVIDQDNPKEVFPANGKRFSIISADGRMAIVDAVEGGPTNNPALDFYDAAIEAGSPLNYVHVIYTPNVSAARGLLTKVSNDNAKAQVDINIVGPLSRSQKVSILKTIAAAPAGIRIHVKAILANDFGFGKSYASTLDNRDDLTPAGARELLSKIPINDSRVRGSAKSDAIEAHAKNIGSNSGALFNTSQVHRASEIADVLKKQGKNVDRFLREALAHLNTLRDKALSSPGLWELYKLLYTSNEVKEFLLRKYAESRPLTFHRLSLKGDATSGKQLLQAGALVGYASVNRFATVTDQMIKDMPDPIIQTSSGDYILDDKAFKILRDRGQVSQAEFSALDVFTGGEHAFVKDLSAEANAPGVYDLYLENWHALAEGHLDRLLAVANETAFNSRDVQDRILEMFNKESKAGALTASNIETLKTIISAYKKLYFASQKESERRAAENFLIQTLRTLHSPEALNDFVGPDMPKTDGKKGNSSEVVAAYMRSSTSQKTEAEAALASAKSMPSATEEDRAAKQEAIQNAEHELSLIEDYEKIINGLADLNAKGITKTTQTDAYGLISGSVFKEAELHEEMEKAKRSILGGHVSLERTGVWQTRTVARDKNGNEVAVATDFPLFYSQSADSSTAEQIANDVNTEYGRIGKMKVYTKDGHEEEVTLHAVFETAHKGAAINDNISINAFLNTQAKLGISITPTERARIIKALSNAQSRARKSIIRTAAPGWNPNVIGSANTQLEANARIISKIQVQRKMNALTENKSFWHGDKGLLEDLQKNVLEAKADGNKARIILADKALLEYAKMFAEVSAIDPKSPTFTVETSTGKQNFTKKGNANYYKTEGDKLVRFINSVADPAVSTEDLITKHGGLLSVATVMGQLGLSVATAAINVISSPLTFISYMSSFNSATGYGHGFNIGEATATFFSAMIRMIDNKLSDTAYLKRLVAEPELRKKYGLSQEEAFMLLQETERGELNAAYQLSMGGAMMQQLSSSLGQAFVKAWMGLFSYSEMLNRRTTALASYRLLAKRQIESGLVSPSDYLDHNSKAYKDLAANITDVVHISQGNYSMSNRPELYRGNILQHVFRYKTFPTMIVEMIKNLPSSGRLKMLAMLWLLSGVKGLPFADDLMDLIDFIMQSLGIKQASFEAALGNLANDILPGSSPVVLRGVMDSVLGGTVSTRAGLGDLIPFTGIGRKGADMGRELQSALGPVYSMAQSSVNYAVLTNGYVMQQLGLAPHTTSFADLIRQNPATGLRALGEPFLYMQDGAITNQQGRVTSTDINPFTIAMRFAGFSPTSLTRENDAVRLARYHDQYIASIKTAFISAYAQARRTGNQDRMAQIRQEVQSWNEAARAAHQEDFVIRDFMGSALRSSRTNTLSASERYAESAPRNTSLRRTVQIATGESQ